MNETTLFQDISRGFACRCPQCGEGGLFTKWLKVVDHCPACGEEFHHHRADDFPAYVVIMILGHIMVPFALWMEDAFSPPMWVNMAISLPLTIILCLALLQPVKGAIVALQWRMRMHGFAKSRKQKAAD
jgi:uncharacterized protein (DUF983 family)